MSGATATNDHRTLPSEPNSARIARTFVGEWLHQRGAHDAVIADLQLVVSELVTNLIVHGDGSPVDVTVDSDAEWWTVKVAGGSPGLRADVADPAGWSVAPPADRSGRGLGIVRELTDDVMVERVDSCLIVTVRVRRA